MNNDFLKLWFTKINTIPVVMFITMNGQGLLRNFIAPRSLNRKKGNDIL